MARRLQLNLPRRLGCHVNAAVSAVRTQQTRLQTDALGLLRRVKSGMQTWMAPRGQRGCLRAPSVRRSSSMCSLMITSLQTLCCISRAATELLNSAVKQIAPVRVGPDHVTARCLRWSVQAADNQMHICLMQFWQRRHVDGLHQFQSAQLQCARACQQQPDTLCMITHRLATNMLGGRMPRTAALMR